MGSWLGDLAHGALINEAAQVATKHLSEAMAFAVPIYAEVNYDIIERATFIDGLAAEARVALARSDAAATDIEHEAEESREVVVEVDRWLDIGRMAAGIAVRRGDPIGRRFQRVFAKLDADSWSNSMRSVLNALVQFEGGWQQLVAYGLPADYLDQGHRLAASLQDESNDTVSATMMRQRHAAHLHELLDEIVHELVILMETRELAMAITGVELPGLELTIARGAAARRSSAKAAVELAPETEPTGL